jgi:glutaredoxin
MEVLLLTQEHCGFCTQARELLDRLSGEYELLVTTLDLNSPAGQALAMHGGVLFPPGIFLNGEPFSYGRPSERKLRRELERRRKPVDEDGTRAWRDGQG